MKYLFIIFLFMMSSTSQATTIYQPVAQPLDSSKVETSALKKANRTTLYLKLATFISGVATVLFYAISSIQAAKCAGMYLCLEGFGLGIIGTFFLLLTVVLLIIWQLRVNKQRFKNNYNTTNSTDEENGF